MNSTLVLSNQSVLRLTEELVGLMETGEKLKQQQQESTRRENVLVMRLATKEQEMQDLLVRRTENKSSFVINCTAITAVMCFTDQYNEQRLLEHNAIKCLSQIEWCEGGKLLSAVITGKILIPSYSTREQYRTVLELSQRLKFLWWLELNYWFLESSCSFQGTNST